MLREKTLHSLELKKKNEKCIIVPAKTVLSPNVSPKGKNCFNEGFNPTAKVNFFNLHTENFWVFLSFQDFNLDLQEKPNEAQFLNALKWKPPPFALVSYPSDCITPPLAMFMA